MPLPKPTFILSPKARNDRDRIYRHGLEFWGRERADAYLQDLVRALEQLPQYPEIGRLRDDVRPGIRSIPIGEHVVYYRIMSDNNIRISRILHARQSAETAGGM